MLRSIAKCAALVGLAFLMLPSPAFPAGAAAIGDASVVKIYVTSQRENYAMPWQSGPQASGSGTGFVIRNKRILTNAHLVADARFIEIQKNGDPHRYRATVRFIAHDCDLAMLEVTSDNFFDGTRPLRLADRLPTLADEVIVLGFPLGGDRLSVTRGIVSRIDFSNYALCAIIQHLVLQVDAAINPGNSGGPVLFNGRVVGLAFQGLAWAENIGYAIPLPVLEHFLADVDDGRYHGYPELGVAFMGLRNPALRRDLGLPDNHSGILIYFVDEFGAARNRLRARDVLLSIDGHPIAEDGTITIGAETFLFAELLERKQWGDAIAVTVWRENKSLDVTIPLDNPPDPFTYRSRYDERAPYLLTGGLVFAPLSQELLGTVQRSSPDPNVQQWFYTVAYVKADKLHVGRDEFVVLIQRMPHPVNAYLGEFLYGIVDEANGQHIRSLRDLRNALAKPQGTHHEIRFVGTDDVLVMDVDAARRAEPQILRTYNVAEREYLGESL
ncbi:MAG: trypsin-like peptidase domain-containing protein [Verrucomicrobia bacterium]|nr:trypsin-like peptidase domain-containing protein [Verrucomicrobiota bacterium]